MTAQVDASFERWIRERPEQWFEAKRRWPRRNGIDAPAPPPSGLPPGILR
jgi:lauroyl/myristoyl acyltransferase